MFFHNNAFHTIIRSQYLCYCVISLSKYTFYLTSHLFYCILSITTLIGKHHLGNQINLLFLPLWYHRHILQHHSININNIHSNYILALHHGLPTLYWTELLNLFYDQ